MTVDEVVLAEVMPVGGLVLVVVLISELVHSAAEDLFFELVQGLVGAIGGQGGVFAALSTVAFGHGCLLVVPNQLPVRSPST